MQELLCRRHLLTNQLPYDAEVEYLESKGGQVIDTLINPKVSPNVIADITVLDKQNTDYFGNTNMKNACYIANFTGGLLRYYRYGSYKSYTLTYWYSEIPYRKVFSVGKQVLVDNDLVYTSPEEYIPDDAQMTIRIFDSQRNKPASFRLHYFKLYDGNVLVRDYIPVRVGNIGYLYDKVSKKLFANEGASNFLLGPDVGSPTQHSGGGILVIVDFSQLVQ